jgi:serine protease Do
MPSLWQQINDSAADAVAVVQRCVVQICTDEGGIGAGVVWHSDGLIVTSAHVVIGRHVRAGLRVLLQDGTEHPAQVLAHDTEKDIAALHIAAHNLLAIEQGNSDEVQPGQWLMALGHPWGVRDALTAGIVIGTGAHQPEMDHRQWVTVDMAMRPGHSGGPLFNSRGQLVGINTMIRGPEVSFAVPVDVVKTFMQDALGKGGMVTPAPSIEAQQVEVTIV